MTFDILPFSCDNINMESSDDMDKKAQAAIKENEKTLNYLKSIISEIEDTLKNQEEIYQQLGVSSEDLKIPPEQLQLSKEEEELAQNIVKKLMPQYKENLKEQKDHPQETGKKSKHPGMRLRQKGLRI